MGPGSISDVAASWRSGENRTQSSDPPTSFFLSTEDEVEKSQSSATSSESTFGVKSMEEATSSMGGPIPSTTEGAPGCRDGHDCELARRRSTLRPTMKPRDFTPEMLQTFSAATNGPPPPKIRRSSPPSASRSLASLSQASQDPGSSFPSSPKSCSSHSLRPSDEDSTYEGGSQAIESSEEEEAAEVSSSVEKSAPQLIMPSIKMPSRRPFTDRGRSLGRLKILIAGDTGTGKTSLIKSIVQTCEDIVHVDSLSPEASTDQLPPRKEIRGKSSAAAKTTDRIIEVCASTRSYASWWSEVDEHRSYRRRKSVGDAVLERNLCFVDTPGYGRGLSMAEGTEPVLHYIEKQLAKTFSFSDSTENEIVSMMAGEGGTQVDLVLYMASKEIKSKDFDFIRRLSAMTNVVPLVAKADLLSLDETQVTKTAISDELRSLGVEPFVLTPDASGKSCYTVCSALSKDEETMDASLLMSPDYVQPLLSSELGVLVQDIFNPDHISRLRHLAAIKLLRHRTTSNFSLHPPLSPAPENFLLTSSLLSSTSTTTLPTSPTTSQNLITHPSAMTASYMQARIADHTQREEKLAQVRLAKWAGDLQRGLHNERTRYEALARRERALWLTQQLDEYSKEGSLVPISPSEKALANWRTDSARSDLEDAGDPLGLFRWSDRLKRNSWVAIQVVGGFGVLGAVAVWIWDWEVGWDGGDWWGRWKDHLGWL